MITLHLITQVILRSFFTTNTSQHKLGYDKITYAKQDSHTVQLSPNLKINLTQEKNRVKITTVMITKVILQG